MIGALPWFSPDGWWLIATGLWVGGWVGIATFARLYRQSAPEPREAGPDPRPPALHVRRRPPYNWNSDGD